MREAKFSVPAIPPSVNHYLVHTRKGVHFRTDEARIFDTRVAICSGKLRGGLLEAKQVDIMFWLGPNQRLDLDNGPKCVLDSLVRSGIIRSDATIKRLLLEKDRAESPQTDIYIRWE